jgi:DNA topoisomerase-1
MRSRKLEQSVKQCRDIPGKELFQYYDEDGNKQSIDSGMVNDYIRELVGSDFTAKDFRTWAGTVQCLKALKEVGPHSSATDAKKKIVEVLDKVAGHLGNTRTVCKKYYVHPCLLDMFEKEKLYSYLEQLTTSGTKPAAGLAAEEKLLLQILRNQ